MKKANFSYLRRILLNVLNGHDIFRSDNPFICAVYLRSSRNTMLGALNCLHNTTTLYLWYFAHVSYVKLFIALIFQTQQHKMLLLIENQLGVSLGNAASTNWTLIPGLKLMKRHKLLKGITSLSNQSHKEKTTIGSSKWWENSLCRQHLWSFIKVYFFFLLICSISQYQRHWLISAQTWCAESLLVCNREGL